jgi:CheY-like chemotaxis protein
MSLQGLKRALVVDDEPHNRKLLETLLVSYGFTVRCADSGLKALEMIDVEKPDVILLDLMMPVLDGFEVTRRLKANPETSAIAIVMITALDDQVSHNRLVDLGVDRILAKPLDRWQLKDFLDGLTSEEAKS